MYKFIIKRILMLIPVILGVTCIVYFIISATPGNPAIMKAGSDATAEDIQKIEHEMGLDKPIIVQYLNYLKDLLRGDMGKSYLKNRSVSNEIASRFPNTLLLTITAMGISILMSIPAGIISAVKQYSITDNVTRLVALLGTSIPGFWMGLMFIIIFSLKLGWFPSSGMGTISNLIMPAVTLSFATAANLTRTTRSSMLDVIRQDYVRTARAKGVSKMNVIIRHAFRNALIPIITVAGLQFGILLGGAVFTETVFAWPGLGRLMVESIRAKDTPMVLGCIITLAVSFSVINLLVDILYGFIDPRIKAEYK